jgi:hypothetical protein
MARPMMMAEQQPSACRKRARISSSMLGEAAHSRLAATYSDRPHMSTGRRP